jgi:soluble lytic murein transglycosylase-like protein
MSIERVMARIAEIEARIEELTPKPVAFQNPTEGFQAAAAGRRMPVNPVSALIPGRSAPTMLAKPFDVALAEATGMAQVRPIPFQFSPEIEAAIARYSQMYSLDPNLIRAVIKVESDGNPRTVSHKGAMGLMQLMPEEVRAYGIKDPFDIEENIMGGARQLAEKLRIFGGNLDLTLAAYNAGTGAVRKYGGIPPYRETENYVRRVKALLEQR